MASVNKVILIGNLTKDPELRYTPSGTAIASFTVACNEKYKDKNGEWQEQAEFINVQVWNKTAENCEIYLHKGSQVYIEGKIKTEVWERDGVKHYTTKVVAAAVQFLGGKKDGDKPKDHKTQRHESSEPTIPEDDIPF